MPEETALLKFGDNEVDELIQPGWDRVEHHVERDCPEIGGIAPLQQ
jgi:hypothetical protein